MALVGQPHVLTQSGRHEVNRNRGMLLCQFLWIGDGQLWGQWLQDGTITDYRLCRLVTQPFLKIVLGRIGQMNRPFVVRRLSPSCKGYRLKQSTYNGSLLAHRRIPFVSYIDAANIRHSWHTLPHVTLIKTYRYLN